MVSVLFNEPKLLKSASGRARYSAPEVSVLFNEPKLLKVAPRGDAQTARCVSVLFNEPKLLKFAIAGYDPKCAIGFSALQRAEIAEMG